MSTLVLMPVSEAVAHHGQKTPIGSVLRTAGWAKMPVATRIAAQFSAGVEAARYLNRIQEGVGDILGQHRNELGGLTDRSGLVRDLVLLAEKEGLRPAAGQGRGTLVDPGSQARAELIVTQQVGQAYGHANWKAGNDEDALDAAPAQELVRIREARVPRDWVSRWRRAGGRFYGGRMIALKSDSIWERISRFGTPWPPYDFNSGMWIEDVSRSEAEDFGLLAPGQRVVSPEPDFTERLQAGVKGLAPELKQSLQSLFGPQIDIDGDTVKWKGKVEDYELHTANYGANARSVFGRSQADYAGIRSGNDGTLVDQTLQAESARQHSVEISAVATGRKPLFHEDLSGLNQEEVAEFISRLRLPQGVVSRFEDGHIYVYHPDLIARFADPNQPLWEQIVAHRDDGKWLGYGINRHAAAGVKMVSVVIQEASGKSVYGFMAPKDQAQIYGAARALDWQRATGQPHTANIMRGKP